MRLRSLLSYAVELPECGQLVEGGASFDCSDDALAERYVETGNFEFADETENAGAMPDVGASNTAADSTVAVAVDADEEG